MFVHCVGLVSWINCNLLHACSTRISHDEEKKSFTFYCGIVP